MYVYICVCVYMGACMCLCVYVYWMCLHVYMGVECTYKCAHVCLCVSVYKYVCVCVSVLVLELWDGPGGHPGILLFPKNPFLGPQSPQAATPAIHSPQFTISEVS